MQTMIKKKLALEQYIMHLDLLRRIGNENSQNNFNNYDKLEKLSLDFF